MILVPLVSGGISNTYNLDIIPYLFSLECRKKNVIYFLGFHKKLSFLKAHSSKHRFLHTVSLKKQTESIYKKLQQKILCTAGSNQMPNITLSPEGPLIRLPNDKWQRGETVLFFS